MKRKIQSLLNRLEKLQSDLYTLQSQLDDKGEHIKSELVNQSAFELNASIHKIEELMEQMQ